MNKLWDTCSTVCAQKTNTRSCLVYIHFFAVVLNLFVKCDPIDFHLTVDSWGTVVEQQEWKWGSIAQYITNSVLPGQITELNRMWRNNQGDSRVPLSSSRPLMLCEPGLAADTSTVPDSMSSTTERAVSKLLFMVVAITPVGPVFSQPLQYRPGKTDGYINFFFNVLNVLACWVVVFCRVFTEYLQCVEHGPCCLGRWLCVSQTALRDRWGGSCSRYC